jgi:hypothetical protein
VSSHSCLLFVVSPRILVFVMGTNVVILRMALRFPAPVRRTDIEVREQLITQTVAGSIPAPATSGREGLAFEGHAHLGRCAVGSWGGRRPSMGGTAYRVDSEPYSRW